MDQVGSRWPPTPPSHSNTRSGYTTPGAAHGASCSGTPLGTKEPPTINNRLGTLITSSGTSLGQARSPHGRPLKISRPGGRSLPHQAYSLGHRLIALRDLGTWTNRLQKSRFLWCFPLPPALARTESISRKRESPKMRSVSPGNIVTNRKNR